MKATREETHPQWQGHDSRLYQANARARFEAASERQLSPWTWITTTCQTSACLSPACMVAHSPVRIAYPAAICVYCGDPAGTRDHLLPKPITGEARRTLVATVPACADCNRRIGDFPSPCVTSRREVAHVSIRKRWRSILDVPDKTPADLRGLGHAMRSVAIKNNTRRASVRARLSWPDDPFYDIRAFQKSGIDDPVALGLIDPLWDPEVTR